MYKATFLRSPSVRSLAVSACTSRKKFAPLDQLTEADLDEPTSRQLPGRGDRLLIQLGNWRGRSLDKKERALLNECKCPGCQEAGIEGLSVSGTIGFARRATHNLYVLLEELNEIDNRLMNGSYHTWYSTHVFNGMFLKLIDYALKKIDMK